MIKVKFKEKNGELSVSVKGHAMSAEAGKDLICSAASMLSYTLAQSVMRNEELGAFNGKPEIRMNSGDFYIRCIPETKYEAAIFKVYESFQTILDGYRLLAQNFPDNISLVTDFESA